jgi:hypothetical protein
MAGTRLAIQGAFTVLFFLLLGWAASPILLGSFPTLVHILQRDPARYRLIEALTDQIQSLEALHIPDRDNDGHSAEQKELTLLPWYHLTVTLVFPESTVSNDALFWNDEETTWAIEQFYSEATETLSSVAGTVRLLTELSVELKTQVTSTSSFTFENYDTHIAIQSRDIERFMEDQKQSRSRYQDSAHFLTPQLTQSGYFSALLNGVDVDRHNLDLVILAAPSTIFAPRSTAHTNADKKNETDTQSNPHTRPIPILIGSETDPSKVATHMASSDGQQGISIWNLGLEGIENAMKPLIDEILLSRLLHADILSGTKNLVVAQTTSAFTDAAKSDHIPLLYRRNTERLLRILSLVHRHHHEMTLSTPALVEMDRCYNILASLQQTKTRNPPLEKIQQLHETSLILDRLFYTESSEIFMLYPQSRFALPKDQMLAIMSPLVLPLVLPLLLGFVREVKRYRKKTSQKKAE